MDLGVNNNKLSFQANIIADIKGRNNIMEPVKKEFARLTRKMEGELYIDRPDSIIAPKHGCILEFSTSKGNVSIISSAFHDLLATPPEKADKKTIKSIAKEFATLFKALNRQNAYVQSSYKQLDVIEQAKRDIYRLTGLKRDAVKRAELVRSVDDKVRQEALAKQYQGTIAKKQKVLEKAKLELEQKYDRTVSAMDRYRDSVVGDCLGGSVPEPNELNYCC